MLSSGTTAVSTSSDTAVTAIASSTNMLSCCVVIVNEGAAPGFWSLDNVTWQRLPAGPTSVTHPIGNLPRVNGGVYVKRVSGGSDLSGVYVWAE